MSKIRSRCDTVSTLMILAALLALTGCKVTSTSPPSIQVKPTHLGEAKAAISASSAIVDDNKTEWRRSTLTVLGKKISIPYPATITTTTKYPAESYNIVLSRFPQKTALSQCSLSAKNGLIFSATCQQGSPSLSCQAAPNGKDIRCAAAGLAPDQRYLISATAIAQSYSLQSSLDMRSSPPATALMSWKGQSYLVYASNDGIYSALMPSEAAAAVDGQDNLRKYATKVGGDGKRYTDMVAVDIDHDGNMDLVAVRPDGPPIWLRNVSSRSQFALEENILSPSQGVSSDFYAMHVSATSEETSTPQLLFSDGPTMAVSLVEITPASLKSRWSIAQSEASQFTPILSAAGGEFRNAKADDNVDFVAIALREIASVKTYVCKTGTTYKSISECTALATQKGLDGATDLATSGGPDNHNVFSKQEDTTFAKLIVGDFDGDQKSDILQVRDGILQLGTGTGSFSTRNYATPGIPLPSKAPDWFLQNLQLFRPDEAGYYDEDFLAGAPVDRDAYKVQVSCEPDQLSGEGSSFSCKGISPSRVAPMYQALSQYGLAAAGSRYHNGETVHRWQFPNGDGAALDLDGDGDLDVVIQSPRSGIIAFLNRGDGYFSRAYSLATSPISPRQDSPEWKYRQLLINRSGQTTSLVALSPDLSQVKMGRYSTTDTGVYFGLLYQAYIKNTLSPSYLLQRFESDATRIDPSTFYAALNDTEGNALLGEMRSIWNRMQLDVETQERAQYILKGSTQQGDKNTSAVTCAHFDSGTSDAAAAICAAQMNEQSISSNGVTPADTYSSRNLLQLTWKELPYGKAIANLALKLTSQSIEATFHTSILKRCANLDDLEDADDDLLRECIAAIEIYKSNNLAYFHAADAVVPPEGDACQAKFNDDTVPSTGIIDEHKCRATLPRPGFGRTLYYPSASEYIAVGQKQATAPFAIDIGRYLAVTNSPAESGSVLIGTGDVSRGETTCYFPEIPYTPEPWDKVSNTERCQLIAAETELVWSEATTALRDIPSSAINLSPLVKEGGDPAYACLAIDYDRPITGTLSFNASDKTWYCLIPDSAPNSPGKIIGSSWETAYRFRVLISRDDSLRQRRRNLSEYTDPEWKRFFLDQKESPALATLSKWASTVMDENQFPDSAVSYWNVKNGQWAVASKKLPNRISATLFNNVNAPLVLSTFENDKWASFPTTLESNALLDDGEWNSNTSIASKVWSWITGNEQTDAKLRKGYKVYTPGKQILNVKLETPGNERYITADNQIVPKRIDVTNDAENVRLVFILHDCSAKTPITCNWLLNGAAMKEANQALFFVRDVNASLTKIVSAGCLSQDGGGSVDVAEMALGGDLPPSLRWRIFKSGLPSALDWSAAIGGTICPGHAGRNLGLPVLVAIPVASQAVTVGVAAAVYIALDTVYREIVNWWSDDAYVKNRQKAIGALEKGGSFPLAASDGYRYFTSGTSSAGEEWVVPCMDSCNQESVAKGNGASSGSLDLTFIDDMVAAISGAASNGDDCDCADLGYSDNWPLVKSPEELKEEIRHQYLISGEVNLSEIIGRALPADIYTAAAMLAADIINTEPDLITKGLIDDRISPAYGNEEDISKRTYNSERLLGLVNSNFLCTESCSDPIEEAMSLFPVVPGDDASESEPRGRMLDEKSSLSDQERKAKAAEIWFKDKSPNSWGGLFRVAKKTFGVSGVLRSPKWLPFPSKAIEGEKSLDVVYTNGDNLKNSANYFYPLRPPSGSDATPYKVSILADSFSSIRCTDATTIASDWPCLARSNRVEVIDRLAFKFKSSTLLDYLQALNGIGVENGSVVAPEGGDPVRRRRCIIRSLRLLASALDMDLRVVVKQGPSLQIADPGTDLYQKASIAVGMEATLKRDIKPWFLALKVSPFMADVTASSKLALSDAGNLVPWLAGNNQLLWINPVFILTPASSNWGGGKVVLSSALGWISTAVIMGVNHDNVVVAGSLSTSVMAEEGYLLCSSRKVHPRLFYKRTWAGMQRSSGSGGSGLLTTGPDD